MLPIQGVILAGGQSRRMGQCKNDLLIDPGGPTLLKRARRTLHSICVTVWVSRPFGYPSPTPEDLVDERPQLGPLMGIAMALAQHRQDLTCVLAVDLPGVPASLFDTLYQHWVDDPTLGVVYPGDGDGHIQPLAGLWHSKTLSAIQSFLGSGQPPRVQGVMRQLPSKQVIVPQEYLVNLNTPEDWARFQAASAR